MTCLRSVNRDILFDQYKACFSQYSVKNREALLVRTYKHFVTYSIIVFIGHPDNVNTGWPI